MKTKQTQGLGRKSLLTGASMLAAALSGVPAMAQDTSSDEEIVVTGSRIPQRNLETTTPITQVTAEDITIAGVTRLEDLTNQLPQVFATQGASVSNGASGTSEISLRGLSSGRTLVLIDGRRLPYGSDATSSADINTIPGAMVERVEVLTGGASAVYGSDAIAGVVNFIMRDNFEGLRVDAQYGFYQHHNDTSQGGLADVIAGRAATNPAQFSLPPGDVADGVGKEISVIFGSSSPDGRGNVTAYATYRTNDAVLQRDRDYSSCSLNAGALDGLGRFRCGGSGTSYPGLFASPSLYATVDQGTGNTFRGFDGTQDLYNFGPLNFYQRPDTRYTMGAFAHYDINDHAEAYGQMMFSSYQSTAQIAPSGNFFATNRTNCDNPMFSASQAADICDSDYVADIFDDLGTPLVDERQDAIDEYMDPLGQNLSLGDATFLVDRTLGAQTCNDTTGGNALATPGSAAALGVNDLYGDPDNCVLYIGRRNVEGGGRQDTFNNTSFRLAGGVRGPIGDSWSYDVEAQYSRVSVSRTYLNELSNTRLARALDVIDADAGAGVDPQCRSAVNGTDPACVPWNLFQIGGVTQAALDYVQVPLLRSGTTIQQGVTATLTGDTPWTSPWAETPIAVAVGAEYRRDYLERIVDNSFATGDGAGQGGPTLGFPGAAADVFEAFGEARIVIAENQPLADSMSLDLAYRRSKYANGETTDTYNIGADWAPIEDIRIRGTFARAVRAANVIELFSAQGVGLYDMADDPCDANDPAVDGFNLAGACIGTGAHQVTAGQSLNPLLTSPAGQYNGNFGGNTNLTAESADTTTYGIVFVPSALPGFTLSVDYFKIEVSNLITVFGAANTIAACYGAAAGDVSDPAACARISRNPGNGRLWVGTGIVQDLNLNGDGAAETSGIDINAGYGFDIGSLGAMNLSMIATHLSTFQGGCEGLYGAGIGCGNATPSPEWRGRFRATWETPWDLEFNGTVRYFSSVAYGGVTAANAPDAELEAQVYLDLAGNWQISDSSRMRFGVNNVLDREPPITRFTGAGFGNGNTFPQVYDAMGRWVFAGVTVDF